MSDREKTIKDFEYLVRKADGEGWDFVDLTTEDGYKILSLLKEQPELKFLIDSDGKMTPLPIQKHGHWKLVQDYDDEHWQCSACGCEWYLEAGTPEENDMHYCPERGAKMDEAMKWDESWVTVLVLITAVLIGVFIWALLDSR